MAMLLNSAAFHQEQAHKCHSKTQSNSLILQPIVCHRRFTVGRGSMCELQNCQHIGRQANQGRNEGVGVDSYQLDSNWSKLTRGSMLRHKCATMALQYLPCLSLLAAIG